MRICVLTGLFVVAVNANNDNVNIILELELIKDSFVVYDRSLDSIVPFKELKESFIELQKLEREYNGRVKGQLSGAINLRLQATDECYKACVTIYSWCVRSSVFFGVVIKYKEELTINDTVKEALNNGLAAIRTSIVNL